MESFLVLHCCRQPKLDLERFGLVLEAGREVGTSNEEKRVARRTPGAHCFRLAIVIDSASPNSFAERQTTGRRQTARQENRDARR